MKKFNFKSSLCGFMAGVIAATAVPVLAYNGSMNILATFKNIKIYIDGAELTPRDSNGNVLEPFIYNGSTYLPIRAVGEAVGKSVSYDANTNSVYLGSSGSSGNNSVVTKGTKLDPYEMNGFRSENITMGGITYKDTIRSYNAESYVYYNLSGAYTSISGVYGNCDGEGNVGDIATLSFYGDDILLGSFNVYYGELPKNFAINVTGVSKLSIEVEAEQHGVDVGFGDMYFK